MNLQITYVVGGVVAFFLLFLLALCCSVRVVPEVSARVFSVFHHSYVITASHAPPHPYHAAILGAHHDDARSCIHVDACDVVRAPVVVESTSCCRAPPSPPSDRVYGCVSLFGLPPWTHSSLPPVHGMMKAASTGHGSSVSVHGCNASLELASTGGVSTGDPCTHATHLIQNHVHGSGYVAADTFFCGSVHGIRLGFSSLNTTTSAPRVDSRPPRALVAAAGHPARAPAGAPMSAAPGGAPAPGGRFPISESGSGTVPLWVYGALRRWEMALVGVGAAYGLGMCMALWAAWQFDRDVHVDQLYGALFYVVGIFYVLHTLLASFHTFCFWVDSIRPTLCGFLASWFLGPAGTYLYGKYAALPFLKAVC